jgi:hypothetical protein
MQFPRAFAVQNWILHQASVSGLSQRVCFVSGTDLRTRWPWRSELRSEVPGLVTFPLLIDFEPGGRRVHFCGLFDSVPHATDREPSSFVPSSLVNVSTA